MGMSRLENVSSISSFTDSMVDWLDILLLPNIDLENNVKNTFLHSENVWQHLPKWPIQEIKTVIINDTIPHKT